MVKNSINPCRITYDVRLPLSWFNWCSWRTSIRFIIKICKRIQLMVIKNWRPPRLSRNIERSNWKFSNWHF